MGTDLETGFFHELVVTGGSARLVSRERGGGSEGEREKERVGERGREGGREGKRERERDLEAGVFHERGRVAQLPPPQRPASHLRVSGLAQNSPIS